MANKTKKTEIKCSACKAAEPLCEAGGDADDGSQEGWQLLTDSHTHFLNSPANLFLRIYSQQEKLYPSTIPSVNVYHTFTCGYTQLENPTISHQSVSGWTSADPFPAQHYRADTHTNTRQAQETDRDTRSYKSSFYRDRNLIGCRMWGPPGKTKMPQTSVCPWEPKNLCAANEFSKIYTSMYLKNVNRAQKKT